MKAIRGACRCGQVEIEVTAPPLVTMACHCRGCQKMTSSAFSLSAAIPIEGFQVVKGEPVIGGMHGATRHYFCPHCMSWMFTRPEGLDYFVNVRSVLLDETRWSTPFVETYASEKLAWAATPARYSYSGLPPVEDYPRLTAEFAVWREG